MALTEEEQILFERLRELRNSIYDSSCYYENWTLKQFASKRPATKAEILQIDPSEKKYERFGEAFLVLINTPADTPLTLRISLERPATEHISQTEQTALGRMWRFETTLYRIVQHVLHTTYEAKWWFQGVPKNIRLKASELHEESGGVIPREYGLMFVDLKEIISKQWKLFSFLATEGKEDRSSFENALLRLNDIRNRLCHPLRLDLQPISDDDASFIEDRLTKLNQSARRVLTEAKEPDT